MNNNFELAIGEKIKSFRKERNITQEQLAEYLSISFQSVSKWERGDAYPDITMLPRIALFFGVTTDELLCIDKVKEQEDIAKYHQRAYDEGLGIGNAKKALSITREINTKYPGNFSLMDNLAQALYLDASAEPDMEVKQSTFKELIALGEKIRAECKDDKIRRNVLKYICYSYVALGEREKAINLADANLYSNIPDSDANVFTQLLEGDKLIQQRQTNVIEFARCSFGTMASLSKDFEPEYRLIIYQNILNMYSVIFKDGDFLFYNLDMPDYYMDIAGIYIEVNDNAKALENIKFAAGHTIAFEETAFSKPFTSPLVNKIPSVGLKFWKNQKGNQPYHLLKRLDSETYNVIRDTPEFKAIIEDLKKHAKED